MDKYKVCIIGCGDIGFLFDHNNKTSGALTHFRAFNESEKFDLIAVADSKKEIREIIKSEYKVAVYDDYNNMCSEARPDAVVIATNDESHYEILFNLVSYNPKLVFCEKPLALNLEDVRKVIELYEENKIQLQVNFTRRFLDEFYEIEELIKVKKIGELESATFYYSRGLIHNASHYLDLINWYIGETEKNLLKISVKEGITERDDTISFDMIYDNGLEIRFIGMNPTKLSFAEVDFIGTKGRVKVNYKNEIEKYKITDNKMFKGYSSFEMYECKPVQFQNALPNAVENIYETLAGVGELKSPATNSIKVFELINRIREKKVCQN